MTLLILVVAVGFLAYYLARRDVDKKAVDASRSLSTKAKDVGEDVGLRLKDLTGQGKGRPQDFISWVNGPGKADLPQDFLDWFAALTPSQQKDFSKAAVNYVDSLGMSLTALTSGRLDSQPDFKKVFVETLVIYSNAYRKIAEAKTRPEEKSGEDDGKEPEQAAPAPEVPVAEKARSRRSADLPLENAQPAS